MDDVLLDGWYRLAAAVVKGLPADDPERERWRETGHRLAARLAGSPDDGEPVRRGKAATRPGHMATIWGESDGRSRARGKRRVSAPISARTAGRQ